MRIFTWCALVAVHGLVATAMLELLLRLWRVEAPEQAIHLRRLGLILPLLVPALMGLAGALGDRPGPFVLLEVRPWLDLTVPGGMHLWAAGAALAALSAGLFLGQEAIPALVRRRAELRRACRYRPGDDLALDAALARAAEAYGGLVLPVWLAEDGAAMACVAGPWRPRLLVSPRLLASLRPRELTVALAHEAAHVLRGDLRLGWAWFLVRAVQCFSPAALLVYRWTLRDVERACDRVAAERTGDGAALASALRALHAGPGALPGRGARGGWLSRIGAAWEDRLVELRIGDLLQAERPALLPWWPWRMAAAAAAVGGILAGIR